MATHIVMPLLVLLGLAVVIGLTVIGIGLYQNRPRL